jgi:hypothetical protein
MCLRIRGNGFECASDVASRPDKRACEADAKIALLLCFGALNAACGAAMAALVYLRQAK